MLSLTVDAVTTAEVTDYATSRGREGWLEAGAEGKPPAIRRATDYLAAAYNARWLVEFDPDAPPTAIKYAIAEAAIREQEEPGSLSEDLDPNGRIKSMTAGSVNITYSDGTSPKDAFTGIENLLVAEGMIKRRSSAVTSFVLRA